MYFSIRWRQQLCSSCFTIQQKLLLAVEYNKKEQIINIILITKHLKMEKYASISLYPSCFVDFIKLAKGRDMEFSLIVLFTMKDSLWVERRTVLVNWFFKMEIYIVDLLKIIAFKAKVFIIGFLVKCMMDFLVKGSKTVMENIYFVMEIYTMFATVTNHFNMSFLQEMN